jgi:phage tail-like protein
MKQDEILKLLPAIFQRTAHPGNLLSGLLAVMEDLHEPDERILEDLDIYFNPYLAPDNFVPYLAGWLDLDRVLTDMPGELAHKAPPPFPSGLGCLRELIASVPVLTKWRGTSYGLQLFLEIATGMRGFEINETVRGTNGLPRPFHIRVLALPESEVYRVLIERIVQLEKPAHVTYELVFESPNERTKPTPVVPPPQPSPVSLLDRPGVDDDAPTGESPLAPGASPVDMGDFPTRVVRVVAGMLPRLEVVDTGRIFPLTKNVTTVGREDPLNGQTPDIDLTEYDPQKMTSRRHARIIRDLERFFVVAEKEAAHGTFLNGQQLAENAIVPLNNGDIISFAQTKLIFKVSSG